MVALQSKKKTLPKDTSGKISKVIATDTYGQERSREDHHWEDQSQTQPEQTKFSCKQEDEEDEKLDTGVVGSFINVDALNCRSLS